METKNVFELIHGSKEKSDIDTNKYFNLKYNV